MFERVLERGSYDYYYIANFIANKKGTQPSDVLSP
jgi:hypothetical protein